MKKKLTVAKTFKKIAKLKAHQDQQRDLFNTMGRVSIRGSQLCNTDVNKMMYNIALMSQMHEMCFDIIPEDDSQHEDFITQVFGDNGVNHIDVMKEYLRMKMDVNEIQTRLDKLHDYMDALPKAEKEAYRLEKATANIDERDLIDDGDE